MIDEKECLKLYKEGWSKRRIALFFGLHRRKVTAVLEKYNIPVRPQWWYQQGETHSSWKGGKVYLKGYVMVYSPNHPYKTKKRQVAEHRLVMEKHLGRYLLPTEVVDHINGISDDNRVENLRVFENNGEHLRVTLKGKIPKWSREGKEKLLVATKKKRKTRSKSDGKV